MPTLVAAVKAEGDEANATQLHQVLLMQIDCEGNGVRNGGFKQSGRYYGWWWQIVWMVVKH